MEKCRICLGNKNTLLSVFLIDNGISYADMMHSLSNVKISKHDSITDKICRSCRKSLRDAYDFKLLIERSNEALTEKVNSKRISFTNLNDIKIKIEINIEHKNDIPKYKDTSEIFPDGVNEISYHNTVIKKEKNSCMSEGPIPVLDFLNSLKEEHINDLDDDYHMDNGAISSDEDYTPPSTLLKKNRIDTNRKKDYHNMDNNDNEAIGSDEDYIPPSFLLKKNETIIKRKKVDQKLKQEIKKRTITDVCIKPVFLRDVRLIYEQKVKNKVPKNKKSEATRVCPHCGILTKTLKTHILLHSGERKFKCDTCGKAYFTLSSLTQHIITSHKSKDFKCDQCTAAFSTLCSLNNHMLKHSSEKKFLCEICSKAFKRRNTWRRHTMMHNSANKTVKCELCNMSFFTKPGLRHHMRVHTGERPYNCEICSQPYSYKHDFNRHCLKKHGIFLKRRQVHVMNDEVLQQERALMKELVLRINGLIKDDKPLEQFEGPQGAMALELAIKAIKARQVPIDFQF